ncbi:hypothetical protein BS47DRAFT_1388503 [Hydnum rufescens UP504]|uniref:Uncharacterized protein n=1 Tax=Hydnum rufescens UP504 TaxID=1448309 RepID=A0A9P6B7J8_9AGAM|nr:hypothetical protein BS47DRAFT_1388503 [Hydnum rufescens UP504]
MPASSTARMEALSGRETGNVGVPPTEPDHPSTGPAIMPNATERITSSPSDTFSEVGAAGATAGQRRLYLHGSKSA